VDLKDKFNDEKKWLEGDKMIAILIIGFAAVCFCLVGIGLSLDHIADALEHIANNTKKGKLNK
jgi:hypothetical protein